MTEASVETKKKTSSAYAWGYSMIFLMPALFVLGSLIGAEWIAVPVFFIVLPLSRVVFGGDSSRRRYSEKVAKVLEALPVIYAPVALACLWWYGSQATGIGGAGGVWLWLSLVVVVFGGICIAHSLVHHVNENMSKLGYFLSGALGYPYFGSEHLQHHLVAPSTKVPEVPLASESVYGWSMRRWAYILKNFVQFERGLSSRRKSGGNFLPFGWLGFLTGAVLVGTGASSQEGASWMSVGLTVLAYVVAGQVLTWLVHAVNYLQHWGLTDQEVEPGKRGPAAWQDTCVAQRWLTLELSMHHEHHIRQQAPYYEAGMVDNGPRAPAGYMVLLVLSLFPPLWFKLMMPVREAWLANPESMRSTDDKLLFCFSRLSQPS